MLLLYILWGPLSRNCVREESAGQKNTSQLRALVAGTRPKITARSANVFNPRDPYRYEIAPLRRPIGRLAVDQPTCT